MANMMVLEVVVHQHFLFVLIRIINPDGVFTLKIKTYGLFSNRKQWLSQVGRPDFFEKNKVEMRVLLEFLQKNYPIPEEFWYMSWEAKLAEEQ